MDFELNEIDKPALKLTQVKFGAEFALTRALRESRNETRNDIESMEKGLRNQ